MPHRPDVLGGVCGVGVRDSARVRDHGRPRDTVCDHRVDRAQVSALRILPRVRLERRRDGTALEIRSMTGETTALAVEDSSARVDHLGSDGARVGQSGFLLARRLAARRRSGAAERYDERRTQRAADAPRPVSPRGAQCANPLEAVAGPRNERRSPEGGVASSANTFDGVRQRCATVPRLWERLETTCRCNSTVISLQFIRQLYRSGGCRSHQPRVDEDDSSQSPDPTRLVRILVGRRDTLAKARPLSSSLSLRTSGQSDTGANEQHSDDQRRVHGLRQRERGDQQPEPGRREQGDR